LELIVVIDLVSAIVLVIAQEGVDDRLGDVFASFCSRRIGSGANSGRMVPV